MAASNSRGAIRRDSGPILFTVRVTHFRRVIGKEPPRLSTVGGDQVDSGVSGGKRAVNNLFRIWRPSRVVDRVRSVGKLNAVASIPIGFPERPFGERDVS